MADAERRNEREEEQVVVDEDVRDDREYLVHLAEEYITYTICGIITVVFGLVLCRQFEVARFVYQCSKILALWCVGFLIKEIIMFSVNIGEYLLSGETTERTQINEQVYDQNENLLNETIAEELNRRRWTQPPQDSYSRPQRNNENNNYDAGESSSAAQDTGTARYQNSNDLPPTAFLTNVARQCQPPPHNRGTTSTQNQAPTVRLPPVRQRQRSRYYTTH